jgi:hypothetical protein
MVVEVNFVNTLVVHMVELLESLKYKTRGEFLKNSPSAYEKSRKNGWLVEFF